MLQFDSSPEEELSAADAGPIPKQDYFFLISSEAKLAVESTAIILHTELF